MTAFLTLLWVGAISQNQELAEPHITNPLPVLKGQIGKGRAGKGKPAASAPSSGYAPLNPAQLPGVSFALRSIEASESVTASSPASQGPNAAFDSALDQLFGKGTPNEGGTNGEAAANNDLTIGEAAIALSQTHAEEEIL